MNEFVSFSILQRTESMNVEFGARAKHELMIDRKRGEARNAADIPSEGFAEAVEPEESDESPVTEPPHAPIVHGADVLAVLAHAFRYRLGGAPHG
jgi:hypothetical protein